MKKIDFSKLDLAKLGETGASRWPSPRVLWHSWHKKYRKQQTAQKAKVDAFFASYTLFDKIRFGIYVLLALSIYTSVLYTYPATVQLFATQKAIATSQANIQVMQADLDALAHIDDDIGRLHNQIAKIDAAIPAEPREEDVITTISALTNKNQLTSPQRIFWSREKPTSIENTAIRNNYDVYAYTFSTVGDWTGVKNIIIDLRKSLRLMDVKNVKIIPLANGLIDLSITFWTYNHASTTPVIN